MRKETGINGGFTTISYVLRGLISIFDFWSGDGRKTRKPVRNREDDILFLRNDWNVVGHEISASMQRQIHEIKDTKVVHELQQRINEHQRTQQRCIEQAGQRLRELRASNRSFGQQRSPHFPSSGNNG